MPTAEPSTGLPLLASPGPLVLRHDVALLDLDGTIYLGSEVIAGAAATVAAARGQGMRMSFVTNNAARTAAQVADHLSALGVACSPDEVVTSAQAAAQLLQALVPAGSPVLVVGGPGLVEAVGAAGLQPVERADAGPRALVQGWSPDLSWALLAEGAYALAAGLPWVVTNTDATLPTPRGTAPGNGSFVELLARVSRRHPDAVAGKPAPPLLQRAVRASAALTPLVVGDRLDTDIQGARAVGLPSLLVLTGVTRSAALLAARPHQRPTFVSTDLAGILTSHPAVTGAGDDWTCALSVASLGPPDAGGSHVLTLRRVGAGEPDAGPRPPAAPAVMDDLRACCVAAWAAADSGRPWHPAGGLVDHLDSLVPDSRVSQAGSAASAGPAATRPA
jgi:glycerol-1-phosphatase